MTKKEFMNNLDAALSSLPYSERQDILRDYEEHFSQGASEGLTEEEICAKLGKPSEIAAEYTSHKVAEGSSNADGRQRSAASTVALGILLVFANLILVFPLWIGFFAALIGLFVAGVAIAMAGLIVMFFGIFTWVLVAMGIGLVSLGVLMCVGLCLLIGLFFKGTAIYCRGNVRLAKGTL